MTNRYEEIPKVIEVLDRTLKMDYGYKVAVLKSVIAYYEGMQHAESMQTLLVNTLKKSLT